MQIVDNDHGGASFKGANMKKRIKKKKHVYPFSEYGIDMDAEWAIDIPDTFKTQEEADEHSNRLFKLIDKIEELEFECGGGGNHKTIGFFMCSTNSNFPTQEKIALLKQWMESTGWWKNIKFSDYIDAWFPDRKLHNGDKKTLNNP